MARKIPVKTGTDFIGEDVVIAFNLHRAKKPYEKGEPVYTVRYKAGGKVLAHVDEIALEDAYPKILPGTLKAIQTKGVRSVCCYIGGRVVDPKKVPKKGRSRIHFNPFKADCFTNDKGRCMVGAEYVLFTDKRQILGVGVETEGGVVRTNPRKVIYAPPYSYGVQSINEGCRPCRNPQPPRTFEPVGRKEYVEMLKDVSGATKKNAERVADTFPNGLGLPTATEAQLERLGLSSTQATRLVSALSIQAILHRLSYGEGRGRINSPTAVGEVIRAYTQDNEQESFYAILLDARQQPIEILEVARGSLAEVSIHPRELFRDAVRFRAHSIILSHNHPSGDSSPSEADIELTSRMVEVGKTVGIPILDHVVVARRGVVSLASLGHM